MKNKILALGLTALLATGCARIPVVGELYSEVCGKPGINSHQYLLDDKRHFVFNFDSFEYYYSKNKPLDLNKLSLNLEYAVKISEKNYEPVLTNKISSGFRFRLGHNAKGSFVQGRLIIDEKLIQEKRFNYYYFLVDDKVLASGEIK